MSKVKRPTQKEKIAVYEDLLHLIQLHAEVTMEPLKVKELINRICSWSYAHRAGNGERSDEQRDANIDAAFWKLDPHQRHVRKDAP